MKSKEIRTTMNKWKNKIKIILICTGVFCLVGFDYYDSSEYTPVLMLRTDLEKSIKVEDARSLREPGKIYAKDNYLFIIEKREGIHVIDNSDPRNPENVAFITIPGNVDMAIKKSIMYVDNAVDMVAIDLASYPEINITKRIRSIFPEPFPPGRYSIPDKYMPKNRPSHTIIVKWVKRGSV